METNFWKYLKNNSFYEVIDSSWVNISIHYRGIFDNYDSTGNYYYGKRQ